MSDNDYIYCQQCKKDQPIDIDLSWAHWDGRSFDVNYTIKCSVCGLEFMDESEEVYPFGEFI